MTTSIITRGSGVSIAGRQSRGLSPAFSRASAAYQGDGRKVGVGVPRFETVDGRRGVLVEEATTNLVANPAFVQGLDGWARNKDATLDHVVLGGKSWCKVTSNQAGSTPGVLSGWIPVSANATYTFSLTGFVGQGAETVYAYVNGNVTSNVVWYRPSSRLGTSPSRKVETFNTGDNTKLRVGALWAGVAIGNWFEVTEVQLEAKPYATSFVDGTRATEYLTLPPLEVLELREGTFECWFQPEPAFWKDSWNRIIGHSTAMNRNEIELMRNFDSSGLAFAISNSAGGTLGWNKVSTKTSLNVGTWYHVAAVWSASQGRYAIYLDGVKENESPVSETYFPSATGTLAIGYHPNGQRWLNSPVAMCRIYRRALTDQEIAAHAAGNIVATDCYHYPFDGDLWPAPGSLGAVVAPAVATRPGRVDVVTRRGSVDIITRPGKLEVIGR